MTTKNAIEAAKITKELKNFTLDVENFAIPQGFVEDLKEKYILIKGDAADTEAAGKVL